ncbi:MAG: methyltransferase [Deltaproteobacteria bacterium]|nr:methyltransferase [Deltaproteobacteria bacterium]MBW2018070.1 methyltransferase [Deltaproteobacteria bacterium]MBW2130724.1 methyltransferase [Deltaproteobacteria bacterium]MBW2303689.1 methyltransferase [Deltaproteobacteria bacterium]
MESTPISRVDVKPNETVDAFLDGRLRLIQSRNGYRFSIDAVLLAGFVTSKPGEVIVDLGTGCGVIPLMLLLTRSISYAVGVEIQPDLADQARRNALLNGYGERMAVVLGDARHVPIRPLSADIVLCNPPYRKRDSGRISTDRERAIARHEIKLSLDDILEAARMLLRPRGRFAMVYPAFRLVDMLVRMRAFGLEPKRIQVVYPEPETDSKLVLVEAVPGGGVGVRILPPLFGQGEFSIPGKAF